MKPRILYLEYLRIIATIAVLVNHIPLVAVHLYDDWAGDGGRFVVYGINHIVHFAVPVFVMITGALLLNKERPISWKKTWNYAWRMIVILATVGVAFAWMEIFFEERYFSWVQIPRAILNTLQGQSWTHLWYLYMLIGLYLILPMLKATVNILDDKQQDILIACIIAFVFVPPILAHFFDFKMGIRLPIVSEYVAYMLIGYKCANMHISRHTNIWTWLLVGAFVMFYVFMAWLEYINGHLSLTVLSAYNSPLMVFYSILIFVAVKRMIEDKAASNINKFWTAFSRDSFGIYVFHMLYVNFVYKVLKINPFEDGYWMFIPIFICVTALSWITTIIFRKLPLVGKYI